MNEGKYLLGSKSVTTKSTTASSREIFILKRDVENQD